MHKALDGKGYIKGGEGVLVTGAGEVYAYRDGRLTPLTATDDPKGYADTVSGRIARTTRRTRRPTSSAIYQNHQPKE